MQWFKKRGRAVINAALALMIVALYVLTTTPAAHSVMGEIYDAPVYRGHAEGVVALSCAVSWNAQALPGMLQTLREKGVRITFMVSGDWAKENKDTLQSMVLDGHEIGTMGMTPLFDGSVSALTQDISDALECIHAACGVKPTLYYSGSRDTKKSTKAAMRLGLTHVIGTVDILSGRGRAQDMLLRALDNPFDGSIVLLQPTGEAAKAFAACLEGLAQQGFRVGTVREAMGS